MRTITMTELNQRVSAVTREVIESGETVRVTNRGRVVLRLVPEPGPTGSPLEALIASGAAVPPTRPHRRRGGQPAVPLSDDLDAIIAEVSGDGDF
ncbi:type II toxin-antitoxin system Phd/YefM family antitoxin [Microbacterium sp.]|uniref:type II toxin-antitoxin system Phd/YefM family antitoxin n=1 Tax=Microbacterium sp. TaxID=51671 RepID=UPI003C787D12